MTTEGILNYAIFAAFGLITIAVPGMAWLGAWLAMVVLANVVAP